MEILGLYFEDFPVGKSGGSVGKTITASDVQIFNEMSSWPIYSDGEKPIVPEMLITMISAGLLTRQGIYEGTLIGVLGNSWRYISPVFVEDTLKIKFVITEAFVGKNKERGTVVFKINTHNQRNEIVAEGEIKTLMRLKRNLE